ncbi:hypothetical protein QYF36_016714 [Acer negundo]|nr:hypothetical protein QYF36_016714 [Acer negundo]
MIYTYRTYKSSIGHKVVVRGGIRVECAIWIGVLSHQNEDTRKELFRGYLNLLCRFLVDNVPIRVFKNNTENGVSYPSKPMHIVASVWGPSWTGHIDWSQVPFQAHYQGFHVDGCVLNDYDIPKCYSSKYWWNNNKLWKLNPQQRRSYQNVRHNFLTYDYCSDCSRYPKPPPECQFNQ